MSKPPPKKTNTLRYIVLIPIISFIIGYFVMGIMQAMDLDVKLLDFEDPKRLNFNAGDVSKNKITPLATETSPEERVVQSETSKMVQLSEIEVYSIQIGSFSTNQQALPVYTTALKNGYGGTIYKDRVIRVLIAAAPTREIAEQLAKAYEDDFESLSIENITFKPKGLIFSESDDPSQLVKATEVLSKLLSEAQAYMAYETITPHSTKEKKLFIKSQRESLLAVRQTLEQSYLNASLDSARENVLQLLADHENYLQSWSDKRSPNQGDLWQGLLSELLLYEQIIR